jgi:hypothetical protein
MIQGARSGIKKLRLLSARLEPGGHAENAVGAVKKLIVAQLILNPENDEKTAGQTNRQARDVDRREDFVPMEVSKSNFEKVAKHGTSL